MTEFARVKETSDHVKKLQAIFEEVADLTINNDTLHDHAVVCPSDLGKNRHQSGPGENEAEYRATEGTTKLIICFLATCMECTCRIHDFRTIDF